MQQNQKYLVVLFEEVQILVPPAGLISGTIQVMISHLNFII